MKMRDGTEYVVRNGGLTVAVNGKPVGRGDEPATKKDRRRKRAGLSYRRKRDRR